MAYVSSDGNYGSDDALMFEHSDLTAEQWNNLSDIGDNERLEYVSAILGNEEETIRELEEAYDLEPTV